MKKVFAVIISLILLMQIFMPLAVVADEVVTTGEADVDIASTETDYFTYYQKFCDYERPIEEIYVSCENAALLGNALAVYEGKKAVEVKEGKSVGFDFVIPESGIYDFSMDYYNAAGKGSDYIISLTIDGEHPFDEAKALTFSRLWVDNVKEAGVFDKDDLGNDIRPTQVEKSGWLTASAYDKRGLYENPYFVYLEKGKHSVTISSSREDIRIGGIAFNNEKALPSYEEYAANAEKYEGENVISQAEKVFEKSNSILYPTYDKTNEAVMPQSSKKVLLNTIGQSNWSKIGDYISWQPEIKEAGWYNISLKVRQIYIQGMSSYRTLKINGEIPFEEAKTIEFKYDTEWYNQTLGGEEPYLFYLEPGDILSLTVNMGPISEILRDVNKNTLDLNALYRDVIAITSASPDLYRNYMLDSQLPELEPGLAEISKDLKRISKRFEEITGTKGSQASIIDYVVGVLDEFAHDCNTIPERLSAFQSTLESLGSLITTISEMPLELDYFVYGTDKNIPKANSGWFSQFIFSTKAFLATFSADYNSVGAASSDKETLEIWVTTGRDQIKIINGLIRNDFAVKHPDIKLKLNIVALGATLIKATLAGKGPDVALMAGTPLELAARDVLVELSPYGVQGKSDDFVDSVWNGMKYNGGIYAIPETMLFEMMFYREDILKELGIEKAPDTWDEFYDAMETIQKSNLKVGIPESNSANYGVSGGIQIFAMLLLQNGGTYYNDSLTKALFDTEEALSAFESWVDIYKEYGNDREFSLYSRFRTGDMPLAISPYTAYNQIAAAAPEIQGLWGIAPIPATVKADGTTSRLKLGTVTGCYMLKSAVKKGIDDDAFTFMDWWTSSETQTQYGRELEATLGVSARYHPASISAMNNLGWSSAEREVLNESIKEIYVMDQVPGNYLLDRSLTTAFRDAVDGKERPRRALTLANQEINKEITRKRKEFKLEVEEEK